MERKYVCDVAVAGGGTAGVAAAAGAARKGARTLLIERNPYLGGEATHSGVAAFCGFFTCGANPVRVVEGAGQMILDEMARLNSHSWNYLISATGNKNINFHPEYLKCAMDNVMERTGVACLFHARITGVRTDGCKVTALECMDDEGPFVVEAKAYVDTTGDANVVHLAGAETLWGDENGKVQAATLPFRLSGVDTSCDLTPGAVEKAVIRAKKEGIPYLTKEKGFILKREGSDQVAVLLPSTIPEGMDCRELTRMEQETRRQVLYYVEAFKKYLHGMENCELTVIGPAIGFRETRRMKGKEIITAEDVLTRRKRSDGVARASWKPEIHMDANKMGQYIEVAEGSWFDVPLGAIQCESLDNLYGAGRMVSSEQTAHAAVRVMGTCFATGHAAGAAAACQAVSGDCSPEAVRAELTRQGALI